MNELRDIQVIMQTYQCSLDTAYNIYYNNDFSGVDDETLEVYGNIIASEGF